MKPINLKELRMKKIKEIEEKMKRIKELTKTAGHRAPPDLYIPQQVFTTKLL